MGLLRQHIAPLSPEAWQEVEGAVRDVLRARLSARRVVDVSGPLGLKTAAVGLGRLEVPRTKTKGTVGYGVHRVQPLVEARAGFDLDLWELDNLARGARDVDLGAAEQAARDIADFEDNAIFNGFEPGGITGLASLSANEPQKLDLEIQSFTGAISTALLQLKDQAIGGPYALVLGPEASRWLDSQACGYPLRRQIAGIFDGDIIYSSVLAGGLLMSLRGGDFELTLGQDLALGYEAHGDEKVKLFLTESFTFRVIEPGAVVLLES
jgi:uncharacterized linocin/CFP29 family protein